MTDLIELARNRAVSDIVLMSGDEDIRVSVQLAQTFGLRIHLLGIGDLRMNSSRTLQQEADTVDERDREQLLSQIDFDGSIPRAIDLPLIGSVSRLQGDARLAPEQLRAVKDTFKSALRG